MKTDTHNLVLTLHRGFATVLLLYAIALAIWGFWSWIRGKPPSGNYLGAVAIGFGVAVLQGLIGVVLLLQGHRPHDLLHLLYGAVAVLTFPVAYSYAHQREGRTESLIYWIAALFLVGIAIRGFMTGGT